MVRYFGLCAGTEAKFGVNLAQKLTGGKIVALLIGAGIAISAASWGSADFIKAPDPRSYKTTGGEIVRVWVDVSKSQRNTCAEYKYEVNGRTYTSSMYCFNDEKFPYDCIMGQPVEVYYQEKSPSLAVLDRKRPTAKMFTALMMIGLLAFGVIAGVFAPDPPWMRKNRRDRPAPDSPSS